MKSLIKIPEVLLIKIKTFKKNTNPNQQDCFDFIKSLGPIDNVKYKKIINKTIPLNFLEDETFLFNVLYKETPQIVGCAKGKARNLDFYFKAVKINGQSLNFVPEIYKTLPICEQAIRKSPTAINYVPKEIANYNFCLKFIKIQPTIISDIPREHLTYELCLEAVKTGRILLYFVPTHHRTVELCLLALEKQKGFMLESENYMHVKVCPNPDLKTTLTNLRELFNKNLIKSTIGEINNG